jgi:hypothetical protein
MMLYMTTVLTVDYMNMYVSQEIVQCTVQQIGVSAETAGNEIMAVRGNFGLGMKKAYHMNVVTKFEVPTEQRLKL